MDILSAILLGLIQGLTEFLPVSSSGHLVLSQHLLGFEGSNLAFDLVVHLATLLAVIIYFRKDIYNILTSAISGSGEINGRLWISMIAIGTVPTAIIGYSFEEQFKAMFAAPRIVALMLWVTAVILIISDRIPIKDNSGNRLTIWRALVIGTSQGLAIIPGISRSGSTISAAIFSGMNPDRAARFSFLLSIPAILGASLMESKDIAAVASVNIPAYAAAALAAFMSGYLAIDILLKMVVKRKLWRFSVYLFFVGLAGLLLT